MLGTPFTIGIGAIIDYWGQQFFFRSERKRAAKLHSIPLSTIHLEERKKGRNSTVCAISTSMRFGTGEQEREQRMQKQKVRKAAAQLQQQTVESEEQLELPQLVSDSSEEGRNLNKSTVNGATKVRGTGNLRPYLGDKQLQPIYTYLQLPLHTKQLNMTHNEQ